MTDENNLEGQLPAILAPDSQDETIALVRGICSYAESISDAGLLICVAYVELEADVKAVQMALGFRAGQIASVIRSHLGQRVIADLTNIELVGTGRLIAVSTLKSIARSISASPAARVKASMHLNELAQMHSDKMSGRKDGGTGKGLNDMSLKELEETAERLRQNIHFIEQQTAEPIDGDMIPD